MKQSLGTLILWPLLVVSLVAHAYFYVERTVEDYYTEQTDQDRARIMDAYDELVCDLICGKTLEAANAILSPSEVVRFKKRQNYGHLYVGGDRLGAHSMEVCLDGDIITAVESSPYAHEKPACVMAAYLPSSYGDQTDSVDDLGSSQ